MKNKRPEKVLGEESGTQEAGPPGTTLTCGRVSSTRILWSKASPTPGSPSCRCLCVGWGHI